MSIVNVEFEINKFVTSFSHYRKLSFKCTLCGRCCEWFPFSSGAKVDLHESTRERKSLRYLKELGVFKKEMNNIKGEIPYIHEKGREATKCIFQPEKGTGKCKIYPYRPFDCRIYPLYFGFSSKGAIIFHIEHCEGVRYDSEGINLLDLKNFFKSFFEEVDYEIMNILIRKELKKKPFKIKLFPSLVSTWDAREKALKRILSKVSKKPRYLTDIISDIISEFATIKGEYTNTDSNHKLKLVSIYKKISNGEYMHAVTGERILPRDITSVNDLNPYVSTKVVEVFYNYLYENILRERRYAINLPLYNITLDDEINMFISVTQDVFMYYKAQPDFYEDVEKFRLGLSRVDLYLDYYLTKLGLLKRKGTIEGS